MPLNKPDQTKPNLYKVKGNYKKNMHLIGYTSDCL